MNKLNKLSRAIFAIAMMVTTEFSSFAHDFEVDGIYYNIISEDDKTVETTYKGASYSTYPNEYIGSVTIPSSVVFNNNSYSVTKIGASSFEGCKSLTTVIINNSVLSIGNDAFYGCSKITTIDIPISVTDIGDRAFCSSALADITIPEMVTNIGKKAFSCSKISSITIPQKTTRIGAEAFSYCNNLVEIVFNAESCSLNLSVANTDAIFSGCTLLSSAKIGPNVTKIPNFLFYGCKSLTKIEIPNSVTVIGDGAFTGCSNLESINLGNSITTIGNSAFADCTSLDSINIPESVSIINGNAFTNCSNLTNIEFGNNVKVIDYEAFSYCSNLKHIKWPKTLSTIEHGTFEYCTKLTEFDFSGIKTIGANSFRGCVSLQKVSIPDQVENIDIYGDAFADCSSLSSLYIGAYYITVFQRYIEQDEPEKEISPFSNCPNLESITIGHFTQQLDKILFKGCSAIRNITFDRTNVSLSKSQFTDATELEKIIIISRNGELPYIGSDDNPFASFNASVYVSYKYLTEILNNEYWSRFSSINRILHDFEQGGIYYYIQQFDTGLNKFEVGVSKSYSSSNDYSGDIVIPEMVEYDDIEYSVVSICENAFEDCSIGSIKLPNTLTLIEPYAFKNSSIEELHIPQSLSSIDDSVFSGAILENVYFEDLSKWCNFHLSSIYSHPKELYLNGNLIEGNLVIPQDVIKLGSGVFQNYDKINNIALNDSLKEIFPYALSGLDYLSKITIPKNVTSLYEYALYSNTNLKWFRLNAKKCVFNKNYAGYTPLHATDNIEIVSIGENVEYVSNNTFKPKNSNKQSTIKTIVSLNIAPPTCDTEPFQTYTQNNANLYVPKGSYAAYWSAPVWQDFKKIIEIEQVATDISLPETMKITLNNSFKLDAILVPTNTTITTLFWESSNPEIAIVDQEGNVTAVANGKATITATTIDGSELSASCEVKIGIQEVESVTLSQKTAELKPKDMLNLTCVISPDNATEKTITWASDNTSVAVVRTNSDGSATVLAVAPGIANITAATNDGTNLSDTCVVKVLKLAESITLDKTTAKVNTGNTIDVTATILPDDADYKNVTWSISDETLATIKTNENGSVSVSAINPGVVIVTATTVDGSNLSASCEITIYKLAESIALDKEKLLMVTGHEETLVATVLPDNTSNKAVTWSTSDANIATIKDNGNGSATITAINPGVVTITATTADGTNLSASCEVTITKLAESITLDNATLSMNTGQEETISATVLPDNTSNKLVVWTISDATLATLKDNGNGSASITAINPGVVTITATTTDGTNLSASCEITINQLAQSIVISPNVVSIKEGESALLTAIVWPENTTDKTLAWTTSDATVVSIVDNFDGTATINVLKEGNASVFASTTDGSNLAAICNVNGISGVENVSTNNAVEVGRFDIYGRRLSKPTKGLNIVVYSDGTTKKVEVKE